MNKLNNHGQALIEFILILPVFLMILFSIVDIGTVYTKKISLSNDMSNIVEIYEDTLDINTIKKDYPKLDISIEEQDKYTIITASSKINLITPGAYRILGSPFTIEEKRYIYNETE